jgi:taurine transport system permease protein
LTDSRRARLRYALLAALSPLGLLALWVLATTQGWVKSVLLPPPQAVLASLVDMITQGYSGIGLLTHVAASLTRVGIAFLGGAVLGTALGLLRGRVPAIDALLLVPSEMLRPVPPLGLIPLFILWFGIGELSKVLLIFLSVFLIMMVNAHAGARSCRRHYRRSRRDCAWPWVPASRSSWPRSSWGAIEVLASSSWTPATSSAPPMCLPGSCWSAPSAWLRTG